MSDYTRVCEEAARAGGAILQSMKGKIQAKEKGPADLVTEADFESQKAIFSVIQSCFPHHQLLGEEDTEVIDSDAEFTWIVDPLDGTTNYVHGLENYSVSVALLQGADVVSGVVFDPVRDHCYRATLGRGAFLNEVPIQASGVSYLSKSLVAASFSPKVSPQSAEVERFLRVIERCQGIRRLGSAALNLCYVAAGKLDAYWATSLKQWDVAAGQLIVREAGGIVRGMEGEFELVNPKLVACGSEPLANELLSLFSDISS